MSQPEIKLRRRKVFDDAGDLIDEHAPAR
jgi:hypothetical protein